MLSPSRGPERLIRMGQWLIALLFAYFLIQVGSSLIADLPLLAKAPQLEQFVDRPRLEPLLAELKPLKRQVDQLQAEAQVRWEKARQGAEGRAFGLRLLFVGPLLALAIWQFRRFRGTDQWPFASACTAACRSSAIAPAATTIT